MYNLLEYCENTHVTLAVLSVNIFMYSIIIYSIFSLFFLFDLKNIKTLNELKHMNFLEYVSITLVICFLSLAGIPPLLGFVVKFSVFSYYTIQSNFFLVIFLTCFNLFAMFFYLQNVRYIIAKEWKYFYIYKFNNIYLSFTLLKLVVLYNFINIYGIFFYNDLYLYFYNCYLYF